MRLTVVGAGYLGLTHAACMADLGHEVLALDLDESKISRAALGEAPFFKPGLQPLLLKNLETGRFRFTTSYPEAAAFGDVHFLCAGNPSAADGSVAIDPDVLAGAVARRRIIDARCVLDAGLWRAAGWSFRALGRP